ncbi:hypothetical protein BTO04_14200 [Polaribacter sp. SA4-10]|uniref:hypothetical protein n=1 Tax=Polaribacter sp. SA4-10 TaxID=754397 RepID=UPI000B3CE20B|nr:hypothetical protein [Polaribacter sp. SA4-10]ARV07774.1 hypothetical protein BTO04_14200 [Polaribacter sp. SA4-10]
MKKQLFLTLILLINFTVECQEYAMNTIRLDRTLEHESAPIKLIPLVENKTYTYKSHGDDVLVIFNNENHTEYYNNKEHYIKSKISWVSIDECYMTIKESNLPNFPFNEGTRLHMKITKVKRGYIFYESTLGGKTWTGKMKEYK